MLQGLIVAGIAQAPVHRLHRDGQPDPGVYPAGEPVASRGLGAHGAVVAAPEEADEAETRVVREADDLGGVH